MTSGWNATRKTVAGLVIAGLGATLVPATAAAQDEARLRKIEAELRALQRTVFPGGDGRYFTPEVDTSQQQQQQQQQNTNVGTPASSSALADVLARLDALEGQLAQLTARTEENANQLSLLETELKEARAAPVAAATAPVGVIPTSSTPPATTTATPAPAVAAPSAARLAAVQAIAKPATADAGDDEYTYGFRLWEAGFYPEARQQLSLYLQRYPTHARASFGRNLLGRAYLDDGQPREAATQFLENYQKDKNGARAPDSLLFLSEAMVGIGDTDRACIALAEFSEAYPAIATGRLKEQYDRSRSKVRCR